MHCHSYYLKALSLVRPDVHLNRRWKTMSMSIMSLWLTGTNIYGKNYISTCTSKRCYSVLKMIHVHIRLFVVLCFTSFALSQNTTELLALLQALQAAQNNRTNNAECDWWRSGLENSDDGNLTEGGQPANPIVPRQPPNFNLYPFGLNPTRRRIGRRNSTTNSTG